jgi:hypothetical protein
MILRHLGHRPEPVAETSVVTISSASVLAGHRAYPMRELLIRSGLIGPEAGRSSRPTTPIRSIRIKGRMLVSVLDVIAATGGHSGRSLS